jgi:DNA-directed RNA polymerase subunit K/omega
MADIKTKVQGLDPNVRARDVEGMTTNTENIYEALAVITKRSRQLAVDLKHELHQKLEEFAVSTDAIEEISENKEQIEISKFYERLPNPVIIATEEFLGEDLHFYYKERRNKEEDQ